MRNHILISLAAAGLFATAETLPLSARDTALFTDSPALFSDGEWGTSLTERYDVAARLALPQMAGAAVEAVSFPWIAEEGYSDVRIWLSRELTVENKVSKPDIIELEAVYADGRMSATLPQPCGVEEGLYVGISFTIDLKETQSQKTPVATVTAPDIFGTGFWVHTSKTYANRWKDLSADRGTLPVFEATLTGVAQRSVTVNAAGDYYTVAGEATEIPVEVVSYGSEAPAALTLSDTSASFTGELTLGIPAGTEFYFGYPVAATLTLPPADAVGCLHPEFAVDKVNGADNADASEKSGITLFVCSSRPEHRPLFEEYTGTGCGYCPRGALGMEMLKEMYGDRFVGVAYHVGDVMSIAEMEDYPNYAPAQPDAYLDRYVKTDPYFGLDMAENKFLVDKVWEAQESVFAPAHLSAVCRWADDDRTRIDVEALASFVRNYDEADFRMAYILAGDGLTGIGAGWMQGNYYSGETGRWPADFDFLVEAPRLMAGVTYDHVALLMPEMRGVPGSLPSAITADEDLRHAYSLSLADAVNLKGESLIQDKDKLYVVALILDAATGRVVNSIAVRPGETAVDAIEADMAGAEYFTLQGIRTTSPTGGIHIERRPDGSTRKVLLR